MKKIINRLFELSPNKRFRGIFLFTPLIIYIANMIVYLLLNDPNNIKTLTKICLTMHIVSSIWLIASMLLILWFDHKRKKL